MDLNTYTPALVKVFLAAATAISAIFGYALKFLMGVSSRLDRIETTGRFLDPQIAKVVLDQAEDRNRIVTTEQAVIKLTDMQKHYEAHYSELSNKLDILPRIDESLKYLGRVCSTIVPREEWELNNRHYDDRLKRTEDAQAHRGSKG